MKTTSEILPFFSGSIEIAGQSHLNKIIELAYKTALKYLRLNHLRTTKILLNEEITIQELAIDCICELFIRDDESDELVIRKTFNKWEPKIETEEDCLYFLNKIVAKRVEQHLFRLLKSEDPFFSKLLDSVTYLIKVGGYNKIYFLGKTFIAESTEDKFEKSFIPTEEFEKIPTRLLQNKKSLLEELFSYLKNETDFNTAIPLNDLINRLKHINFSDFLVNEFVSNEYTKIEVNELIDEGLNTAIKKLFSSYVEKGKLDREEGNAFESALREMAMDLSDGGINTGLYKYLSLYIIELTEEDYQNKYHNILEYLLKVMKNNIALKLTNND